MLQQQQQLGEIAAKICLGRLRGQWGGMGQQWDGSGMAVRTRAAGHYAHGCQESISNCGPNVLAVGSRTTGLKTLGLEQSACGAATQSWLKCAGAPPLRPIVFGRALGRARPQPLPTRCTCRAGCPG